MTTYKILLAICAAVAVSSVIYIIYNENGPHANQAVPNGPDHHGHSHGSQGEHEKAHVHDEQDGNGYKPHEHEGEEGWRWSKEKMAAAAITIQSADAGDIQNTIRAPGQILIHPNHIAYLIPKVSGTVKVIRKEPGDRVEEREVLAVLESKEMAESKAAYLAALKRMKLKEALLKREEELKQISPEQDYLQAQLALEEAKIDLELSRQKLFALGLDAQEIAQVFQSNGTDLRFYEMRAPFSGQVIQRDLTLGELVDDKHKAYTIADFSRVWVELNVDSSSLPYLRQGQPITVSSSDGVKAETTISHIGPTINEETRKAIAIAIMDNRSGQWIPGIFVTALIQKEAEPARLVIPKEAVQKIKGRDTVFVFDQDSFTPRSVKIGRSDEKNVEITSGLQQGERYAATQTFLLKADLEKSEAEHTH